MLASIDRTEHGYFARFERRLKHSVEEVWSYLTDNEKLKQWFPELRVEELREGGTILFDMGDGTFEKMNITRLQIHSLLEYTWADDLVRFELSPEPDGCFLVFQEELTKITDHTAKDLAGWHVCLDVIEALLDGRTMESRFEVWKTWHEKYVQALSDIKNSATDAS
ncbi:SRPBCC family protein [Brevibacillus ruminantium]|uniref:SRPBCC family protein n=1 Tax=Brevibacillus ruminantium TaxID=2950604 RepID=A0ABY4WKE4_9BACL|nr:SRPBCC family protein [Brevibacillus ruminantium]USG67329.1 SRPBCC family protein [Brevibacillus ruminantium]